MIDVQTIDQYNAASVVAGLDLNKLKLVELGALLCQLHRLNDVAMARKKTNRRFEVRGRFLFESDLDGRLSAFGSDKETAIRDIKRMPGYILCNREARVGEAMSRVINQIRLIDDTHNALCIAMDRIELRVLKGELTC